MSSTEPEADASAFLAGFDMWNSEHERVKWGVFDYARQHCPVAHTDAGGGGQYLVTRYQDVRRVLEDPYTFSSTGVAPKPSPVTLNPLDADPPYQPDLRKILNPLFSRSFLRKFEPQMRAGARSLIANWVERGRVEFVSEFAAPFVGRALAEIVFNETDSARMQRAIETVFAVALEGNDESYFHLAVLAGEYIAERQDNPVERNDVLSAITTGTVQTPDGGRRQLTEDERLGVVTVVFLGGLDTTRGAISAIAHHLARRPELEARVRDPKWVRQDMDEFVRLDSPVACLGRTVMKDVELNGVALKKGEQVLVRFDAANRDPSRFVDPDELRFDETRRVGNAGYGLGLHRCLGVHLARIQIAVAYEELLAQVTNLRFACGGPEDVHWAPGIANGPETLELIFDRVAAP